MAMAGSSSTSAPCLRSFKAMADTNSLGLVTSTLQPARGSFSYQANSSAREQTRPTTMMAGVPMPARAASSSRVEMVATTRLWPAVVPCCRMAAGISGSMPALLSPARMSGIAVTPMRKTRVPSVRTRASKSMFSSSPARLCPVIMCTEEQKSRCVTGIPL